MQNYVCVFVHFGINGTHTYSTNHHDLHLFIMVTACGLYLLNAAHIQLMMALNRSIEFECNINASALVAHFNNIFIIFFAYELEILSIVS